MWFARLFGGRDDGSDDELPTAAPQRPVIETSAAATQPVQNVAKGAPRKSKGFDPYNSGQFERRNAWERVGKR
jgi:hypothetical protein